MRCNLVSCQDMDLQMLFSFRNKRNTKPNSSHKFGRRHWPSSWGCFVGELYRN